MKSPFSSAPQSNPSSPAVQAEIPVLDSFFPSPTRWNRIRQSIREPMAEFFGVAIFLLFGAGVDCQVVLSTNTGVASSPRGDWLSLSFGWAVGLSLGAWVSGGISGGHINPAITLALATWRGFPWRKVPIYITAQVFGGLIGAALVYGTYYHAINIFEGGSGIRTRATAGLFSTYALDYLTPVSCFFSEFLGTAILAFIIMAATDKKNNGPPKGLAPLIIFIVFLGLGAAFGMQTSFGFNPARDFGPRLFLSMAGYGKQLYTYRNQYWIWCPIIAPFFGAQAGVGLYELFLRDNSEEPTYDEKKIERTPGVTTSTV